MVDFTPYNEMGLLEASPYSVLEVPTAVFFLDDDPTAKKTTKTSSKKNNKKKSALRLMPLAIKFSVSNQNVYSPMDTHADW